MFSQQLKKILDLVNKTGDRVIIFDGNNPDQSYVVMGFDNYSGMVDSPIVVAPKEIVENKENSANIEKKTELTEDDLTDKINREISMWKNRDNSVCLEDEDKPKKVWQIPPKVKDKAQEIKE